MIHPASLAEVLAYASPLAGMAFARRAGERMNRRGLADPAGSAFTGNFASLFPGAYQVVQTDRGLTYGGTPLASAGNTSTTTLTLSGSLAAVPVPIWAKATNSAVVGSGATFNVYYDGAGITPAMTGVVPNAGVGVPLTGAGTGLTLTWAAGSGANNDIWKATCSAWADQSGNANHYSQAVASQQPVVTVGLNGKPGLLFDGVDDFMAASSLFLAAPATTPFTIALVGRWVTWAQTQWFSSVLGTSEATLTGLTSSPQLASYNGVAFTPLTGTDLPVGSWGAIDLGFGNAVTDYLRAGSGVARTGTALGNAANSTGRRLGCGSNSGTPSFFSNIEVLAVIYMPLQSVAPFRGAVNTAGGYGVGNVLV